MEWTVNLIFFFLMLTMSYFILIVIPAYILWSGLERIPEDQRDVNPSMAWLICIPFIGIVFLWILLPFKIPKTLKNNLDSDNLRKSEDFGKLYGMMTMVSYTCMYVPALNIIATLATPILFILYLMQFSSLIKNLPEFHNPHINNLKKSFDHSSKVVTEKIKTYNETRKKDKEVNKTEKEKESAENLESEFQNDDNEAMMPKRIRDSRMSEQPKSIFKIVIKGIVLLFVMAGFVVAYYAPEIGREMSKSSSSGKIPYVSDDNYMYGTESSSSGEIPYVSDDDYMSNAASNK